MKRSQKFYNTKISYCMDAILPDCFEKFAFSLIRNGVLSDTILILFIALISFIISIFISCMYAKYSELKYNTLMGLILKLFMG